MYIVINMYIYIEDIEFFFFFTARGIIKWSVKFEDHCNRRKSL